MKFESTDFDWSDADTGMTLERFERYKLVIDGIAEGLGEILAEHHEGYTMIAHIVPAILSTVVRGDRGARLPIVMLESNRIPPNDLLHRIGQAVTNNLPVSRVIYRFDKQCPDELPDELMPP